MLCRQNNAFLMKKIVLILSFLVSLQSFAQSSCAHDKQREQLYKEHPELAPHLNDKHDFLEKFTRSFRQNDNYRSNLNIRIPVVFHIVHDNGIENISDDQIHESIVQLNEDFSASNPELTNVHPNFESLVSNVGFEFRLADLDPNGEPTTGINRIQSELTYNGSNLALKQMVQWDPTMYLNIWVVYSSDGGNGSAFAYYPADVEGSGSIYDGVVSSYWAVGRTETAVWTHYKILTHEVGHWANLKHTWGDQSNNQATEGCSYDDGVEDTPNTIGNTSCDTQAVSCGTLDNVQNYMDYSDCSSMFTEGQKIRMLAAMNSEVGGRLNIWSDTNHELVFIDADTLPRIVYNQASFSEDDANDGSINSSITIELIDLTFNQTGSLTQGLDYTTQNTPDGTTISIEVMDDTHAEIIMTGVVSAHAEADALSNIELHFTTNAFANIPLEEIYNPSKTNIGLIFMDPYEIIYIDEVDDIHNFYEGQNWQWFSMGSGDADFGLWTYGLTQFKLETYGKAAVCQEGTYNLTPLSYGELIEGSLNFTAPGSFPDQLNISNTSYTSWNGTSSYAGVSFSKNGNTHYGWIRIKVSDDGSSCWVMDMAYHQAPDTPIYAGQTENPHLAYSQTVFYESNINNGSISSERQIDVYETTWLEFDTLYEGDGFNISDLPDGLEAILHRQSNNTVLLSLEGTATSHQNNHDNSYLSLSFDAAMFSNDVGGMDLSQQFSLDFSDPYSIVYEMTDTISVSESAETWKSFDFGIGDADFGLWYVNDVYRLETYAKSGICNSGATNMTVLAEGDSIFPSSNWTYTTELEEQLVLGSSTYTDWQGQTAFIGVKFTIAEQFHYGWMRFEVNEAGDMYSLIDYAYNLKPEEGLLAGQIYATYGCIDSLALNYNSYAIEDDGSCTYPLDCGNEVYMTIEMTDAYGDGWNNNLLSIVNFDGEQVQSLTLNSGSSGNLEFCLAEDCYTYTLGGGSYVSEVGWTIYQDSILLVDDYSDNSGAFSVNGACGCTDPLAINYDENASTDDGSCIIPLDCGVDNFMMLDISGGSYPSEIGWEISGNSGGSGYYEFCLSEGCHLFEMTDSYGDGWNGNIALITDQNGDIVFEGTLDSGFVGYQSLGVNTSNDCSDLQPLVLGCTDPEAINYSMDANEDDGSCEYPFVCDLNIIEVSLQDSYGDGWNGNSILMINSSAVEEVSFSLENGGDGALQLCIPNDCYTFELVLGDYTNEISWQIIFNDIEIASGENDLLPQDAISVNATCASEITSQTLSLANGWNMISTYIQPENIDLANVLSPIELSIEIAKDYAGNAYLPEWNYNGIGNLNNTQGYQIKVISNLEMAIQGVQLLPVEFPIPLNIGWNLIAYIPSVELDASEVLLELVSSENLVIAKDFLGNAYLPQWNFNGIGNMKPGQGYQLKVNVASDLQY